MKAVIGILDEQTEYAGQLVTYLNGCHTFGYIAKKFENKEEMERYCSKEKLQGLLLGWHQAASLEEWEPYLAPGGSVYRLSEEPMQQEDIDGIPVLFRYERADRLLRRLCRTGRDCPDSSWYVVYSPDSAPLAEQFAWKLAGHLAETGRTLLLPWQSFSLLRKEGECADSGLSTLLYAADKQETLARQVFDALPKREGVEYVCGADSYQDLWSYSYDNIPVFFRLCKKYGSYEHMVLLAGEFSGCVERAMEESRAGFFLYTDDSRGEARWKEFVRQMKYAGKQALLSRLHPVKEGEEAAALEAMKGEEWKESKG